MTLVVHRVGEEGFVAFLGQLVHLGVLTRQEKVGWIRLHGAILRLIEEPLDDGERLDEEAFAALVTELGGMTVDRDFPSEGTSPEGTSRCWETE